MATDRVRHNGRLSPLPNEGLRKRRLRRMVTVAAAAALAGVDESTMRRALASGRVKGEKPGRDWLVDAASAAAFQRRRSLNKSAE